MKPWANAKCLGCSEFFLPDYRNRNRQRHCASPPCRKAAKAQSQRRWLQKPENQNYFRGPENTRRVQQWREHHPGYWRNKKPAADTALQEDCSAQAAENKQVVPSRPPPALQDLCLMQPAVLVGLISSMTGSALQEDIARSARSFLARGQDILGVTPAAAFVPSHEKQTPSPSRAAAARAAPV
jgi:hypothetical protein